MGFVKLSDDTHLKLNKYIGKILADTGKRITISNAIDKIMKEKGV